MVNKSKYTNWYNNIINTANGRTINGYTETHHILPKCIGGDDSTANLVKLTAREHFICHWLLSKMTNNKKTQYQLWNAFSCMLYRQNDYQKRYKISSRIFENIKIEGSKIKRDFMLGKNNPMYGKTHTKEAIEKIRATHKGAKRSAEAKANMSRAGKGKPHLGLRGRKQTPEHISKRTKPGRKHSPKTIAKMKAARAKQKNVRGVIQGTN